MRWLVASPFIRSAEPEWILTHIQHPNHRFEYVSADYKHDRSRQSTSAVQWLDYLRHAARTWFSVTPWQRDVGFVTAFPQIPVMLGLIKRLTFSRRPILAGIFNLGQTYGGAKGALARFGLSRVDLFMVHSTAEIDSYSSWLQLPPQRFMFIPLSIQMRPTSHEESPDDPFVFAMGSANRDYRLLFDVVAALGHKTIVVAGAHATDGLEIPANVTVLSGLSLEECHRLCQQARVNVVPVDNVVTASGQVTLLETMMYGKAVVATHCVGTADYVVDGVNAVSIPAKDAGAMSAAIDRLWTDPAMRQRLGRAASQYIHEKVSFEGVSSVMLAALERLRAEASQRHP